MRYVIPWLATSCLLVSYPDPAERSTDTGRDTVASDESPSPSPSAETGTASTGPTSQTGATETGLGVQTVTLLTKVGTAQQNVSFVAFQEADGPWTAVTGAGGRYEAAVAPGPFGVVSVCADARGVSVSELRATTQEVVTLQRVCPAAPPEETYEVSGTILGLDPEDDVTVVIGDRVVRTAAGAPDYAVSEVPPGSYSVFALVRSASVPTHLARRDLVEISRNRTVDLDLTGKGTFWSVSEVLPVEATITGERADEIVTVLAQRLLPGDLEVDFSSDATAPYQVHAAPALEGEVNRVIGIGLGTAEGSAQRFVAWHLREAPTVPLAAEFPEVPADPALAAETTENGTFVLWSQVAIEGAVEHRYGFSQADPEPAIDWQVALSAGWVGTGRDYAMPALRGELGWNAQWELRHAPIAWTSTLVRSDMTYADFLLPVAEWPAGSSYTSTTLEGTIIPSGG